MNHMCLGESRWCAYLHGPESCLGARGKEIALFCSIGMSDELPSNTGLRPALAFSW